MRNLSTIDWIAYVLVIIGALNWGLVALGFNLVTVIADATASVIGTIIYALVALSGLWLIYLLFK